jgi:N-acetyl-D-muramate 6-phosphate phosphatase
MQHPSTALLFDLDGTLVDSAPDLAAAANTLRSARGMPPLPLAHYRPHTSAGARGMLAIAMDMSPSAPAYEALKDEFLACYERLATQQTRCFPAMAALIDRLDQAGVAWGIVTNKATRFTEPIVAHLGLDQRAATVVCGDTTPHAKPHPAPLLEAARRIGIPPNRCVYVGDDLRDVQAGRAAGMKTVAVRWGYLGEALPIEQWGADAVIDDPMALLQWAT